MKRCPYCDSLLPVGEKVCRGCGAEVSVQKPEPPVHTLPSAGRKKRKGILIAGIAFLAVLAAVLLIWLLGGREEDSRLGRYEAISAVTDGGAVSVEDEWIELKKRGKAELYMMGDSYDARWSTEGKRLTLKQSGDTYRGELENGVLKVDFSGIHYTFAKEGAGPVTYKAVACISHGQILDEEMMDLIGGCYVVFHGDGTGVFWLFGEQIPITYDDREIELEGETMDYSIADSTMELTYPDGSSFELEVTDEDPADTVPDVPDEDPEAWAELPVETDALAYLEWPGQILSQMDLSDTSLSLEGDWGEGTVWFRMESEGSVVERMSLYIHEPDFDALRERLSAQYGEPTEEGEEPYVASNGGAVRYCWFAHPAGSLRLSAGDEQDFSVISITVP